MNCDLGHYLGLIKGLINVQGKEVGEDSRRRNWLYSNVQVFSFFPFPVTAVWDEWTETYPLHIIFNTLTVSSDISIREEAWRSLGPEKPQASANWNQCILKREQYSGQHMYLVTSMDPAPALKKSVSSSTSGFAKIPAQISCHNKTTLMITWTFCWERG